MSPNSTSSNNNCPESAGSQSPADSGQSFLNVLVLGLGNILLSDEGVGVRAVEELQRRYDCSDDVEIVDGGTVGFELLPYFDERSHILIVDAVKADNKPGTIVRIDDPPAYFRARTSPHQIGLADVMGLAAISDNLPQNIILLGMEPKRLATGLTLSREIEQNLSRLVDMVVTELEAIGVKVQSKET